jgi:hypothetical protein
VVDRTPPSRLVRAASNYHAVSSLETAHGSLGERTQPTAAIVRDVQRETGFGRYRRVW